MYVYAIFLSTLSSSLTSYFYVLLYLFLAISFVLALKLFVYYSLIAANIVLVYIFGFVVISINFVSSLMVFGLLTLSFYLYLFLSVYYSFLLVLFLIELFSSFFNSLTLTNRLSINIFVGSLLINLLSLLSSLFGVIVLAVFFIYESLNLLFQSFIFLLLSFFYLSFYFHSRSAIFQCRSPFSHNLERSVFYFPAMSLSLFQCCSIYAISVSHSLEPLHLHRFAFYSLCHLAALISIAICYFPLFPCQHAIFLCCTIHTLYRFASFCPILYAALFSFALFFASSTPYPFSMFCCYAILSPILYAVSHTQYAIFCVFVSMCTLLSLLLYAAIPILFAYRFPIFPAFPGTLFAMLFFWHHPACTIFPCQYAIFCVFSATAIVSYSISVCPFAALSFHCPYLLHSPAFPSIVSYSLFILCAPILFSVALLYYPLYHISLPPYLRFVSVFLCFLSALPCISIPTTPYHFQTYPAPPYLQAYFSCSTTSYTHFLAAIISKLYSAIPYATLFSYIFPFPPTSYTLCYIFPVFSFVFVLPGI